MNLVTVPLREFALPSPRTGSIEAHAGYGRAAVEGQEIHRRVQRKRSRTDPAYEPEAVIRASFEREGYRFLVEGRMDGIFRTDPPKIEEIKTSFAIHELAARLSREFMNHPYVLQLLTYGYFHQREHAVVPELSFHLVSTRSCESRDLAVALDLPVYETWLDRRLDELAAETKKAEKRAARRRKIAGAFAFPFPALRSGQDALISAIELGMAQNKRMLIQAPTGLGKTSGVLYPVLKEALSRGQRTVYVTPKNSQHALAEDAVARFQNTGAKIKSLSITAKHKICFKNEPLCDPGYCEFAADYHGKVRRNALLDQLAKKRSLKARTFRSLGETYEVCPFELQLDAAEEADTVICDYNYVFAPRSAFRRMSLLDIDQTGNPNLVIDEAHNLPSRAMEYYSPTLSTPALEMLRDELRALPHRFAGEAADLLDAAVRTIASCKPSSGTRPVRIEPPLSAFQEHDAALRAFLSRYLESDVEIRQRDPVMRLCFSWSEFTEALGRALDPDHGEFFVTFHPHPTGGMVKITCCDASAMLKDCYDDYDQVVGFSATLKPFDYYAKLSGLDFREIITAEFSSPFPREHRKLLIIPQISTKYSDRERNYARITDAIRRIAALRPGNYLAFFPSFEFLDRAHSLMHSTPGFALIKQERDMKLTQVETILEQLRAQQGPSILFGVQGGVFSEGLDYPGEMVIGAFVIGPPLPNYDLERELMRKYYQKKYNAGFEYAYTIPAMSKAVQAAGRVIRSETDHGLIVLMDQRFVQTEYSRSMPGDWFASDVAELVSEKILKDVSDFWRAAAYHREEGEQRCSYSW
jgi:DNA excision repair protein ERCC-2